VRFISFRYKVSIAFRTIYLVSVIGIYDTPCLAVTFPKLNHRTALSCPGFAKASPVASRLVLPPDDIHYTNRLTPRLRQKKVPNLTSKVNSSLLNAIGQGLIIRVLAVVI